MTAQRAIACSVLRGGTSKGLYFLAGDLPGERSVRDAVLLAAMGAPDEREIDGMGGGHPLTSKVAVVRRSERPDADVDYLFLQVWPDRAEVTDSQNCGNILAGVGPFALEHGLVDTSDPVTSVRIFMQNTNSLAVAHVETPGRVVSYDGGARIDGVPGSHAPIPIDFLDIAGSSCGALLPTRAARDVVHGIEVTCVDNGMPVVCVAAVELGLTGYESPAMIEADEAAKTKVEQVRLKAGPMMNLGDVAQKTVPKVTLLAPARDGGTVATRTFIPHRVHEAIGVFGAVSVATACLVPGSVAAEIAGLEAARGVTELEIEHPTGSFSLSMDIEPTPEGVVVHRAALLRTARLLMRGEVLVPGTLWAAR